jgi:hypothetical protein
MSHLVSIDTEIRDQAAIHAACQRLGLPNPIQGTHELYSGTVEGLAVQLPDWRYPIVCNVQTAKVDFDNYGGYWGNQKELDRFLHVYAVEKIKIEARRKGRAASEQALDGGWVKLTVQVGAAT